MGDISVEPSMEEILSSIKRIIAEEGDNPPGRRRPVRVAPDPAPEAATAASEPEGEDEVLELSDPVPAAAPEPVAAENVASITPAHDAAPAQTVTAAPAPSHEAAVSSVSTPVTASTPTAASTPISADPPAPAAQAPDTIVSPAAANATRGALESLSRLVVKPEPHGDNTLEGMVRDMLRPMLREWLDANLPDMVEAMVSREIARITGLSIK